MTELSETLLGEIRDRLVREFKPERIYLFGSHAWGTPTPDSDVDLMVIVSSSEVRPPMRASRAHRCLRGLGIPKDVLVKTQAEFARYQGVAASLEHQVLTHGKLLYGKLPERCRP